MRARRLQEVYCRFEIRRTLRAAYKDERHLLRFSYRLFIIVCSCSYSVGKLLLVHLVRAVY